MPMFLIITHDREASIEHANVVEAKDDVAAIANFEPRAGHYIASCVRTFGPIHLYTLDRSNGITGRSYEASNREIAWQKGKR